MTDVLDDTVDTPTAATADTSERALTLPSGNSLVLRDWSGLTRGDKRTVLAGLRRAQNSNETIFDLNTGLLRLLVTSWTYQLPLPNVAAGSLDMLPWADDSAIQDALEPVRTTLFPTAATTTTLTPGATVNLPSGAWVTLRDWRDLNRGDKRGVISGCAPETYGFDLNTGLLRLLVANWSYPLPLPKDEKRTQDDENPSSLDQLPWGDDATLAAALTDVKRALFPAPAPATPEEQKQQEEDPTSPTTGDGE